MKTILFVFGTRPEAIKIAPIVLFYKKHYPSINLKVCITAQHREMLDEVLRFFSIEVDYDLNLMKENQRLTHLTSGILSNLQSIIEAITPSILIVQGDTTTAMAGALAGFYNQIPVAHVEAGLRSGNRMEPFPEEVNRKMIAQMASFHFAPTKADAELLVTEKVEGQIHVTGNTVIDALITARKINSEIGFDLENRYSFLAPYKKMVLTTVHRRENFGEPLLGICRAIVEISKQYGDVCFVLPVHPNPNVKKVIFDNLSGIDGIFLLEPLSYSDFIWLMNKSYMVLTDSGGIQEEAPAFGKPVIVMRNVTERISGLLAGNSVLAGNDYKTIVDSIKNLIDNQQLYASMSNASNPYGDGSSSKRISDILNTFLELE